MKNISTLLKVIFFSVVLLAVFFFAFRDKEEPAAAIEPITNAANIREEVLPPGKPALEATVNTASGASETVALAGNDRDITPKSGLTKPTGREEDLKTVYKNLLVFHADDTMEVNRPRLATLILSKNASISKMKEEVLEASDAKDDKYGSDTTMDFGSKMKARLVQFGASKTENSFEIEALGEDVQTFREERNKIIWQWKVTPLKPGQQDLKLTVQVIEQDGEAVSLPARSIPVIIFAKPESIMSKVGDFIEKKYEFLITAILIPVIIAWFTTRLRNRANSQTITEFHKGSSERKSKAQQPAAPAAPDQQVAANEPPPPPMPPIV